MTRAAANIGAMRHRVTVEAAVDTAADGGTAARTWAVLGAAWAEIAPERAGAAYRQGRNESQVSHRVRLRYRIDFKTADRILLGSRTFRVLGLTDVDEAHRVLEFTCREDIAR